MKNDLIRFLYNLAEKMKNGILGFFGKAEDAYNEYDLSLTVTGHHDGEDFAPTGKKTYNRRIKVRLGDMILAAIALFSALSVLKSLKNMFDRG